MGGVVSMVGGIIGGEGQRYADQDSARLKGFNERRDINAQARTLREQEAQQVGAARTAGTKLEAKQNIAYANSGVDASVGTAADVKAETGAVAELDAQTIKNNAYRKAWGYRNDLETSKLNEQAAYDSAGRKADTSLLTNIGGGMSSGVSSAAGLSK